MSFPVVFRNRNRSLVLWGCILVTLGISPWKNYDSVNLPKSLILSSFAFALIAFHFFYRKTELKIIDMKMLVLCAIFIISLSLPLLFTEAPLNQQFWGIFGRGNGWLSYACLLVMFYSASLFTQYFDFIKLINAFIVTASILSVYALIQFGGKDPIPWSQKMVIATLGNINFLSAFFGMTSLAAVSLAISGDTGTLKKVFLFSLTLIDLFLVQFTGSIQGIMLFCGGSLLIIYLKFRNNLGFHNLRYFYLIFVTLSLTAVIAGLANQGPLARYIFAPSVLFRADYWHAGFKISLAHPFFGVDLILTETIIGNFAV